mmetsp:Transcript_9914/g.60508  ORF Transcript_9914/g.60508 Transcript_9914/m.60508 type:complete len:90 (-) Transcript_9914:1568-1837(-)
MRFTATYLSVLLCAYEKCNLACSCEDVGLQMQNSQLSHIFLLQQCSSNTNSTELTKHRKSLWKLTIKPACSNCEIDILKEPNFWRAQHF